MVAINMRSVIRSFGKMRSFERAVSVLGDDGKAHQTRAAFTAKAIVQPAGKDDLELLEEGQRFFPTQLIHISQPLNVGDYMNYHGEWWRIVNAQDWSENGFHRCIAIRLAGTEESDSEGFTVT